MMNSLDGNPDAIMKDISWYFLFCVNEFDATTSIHFYLVYDGYSAFAHIKVTFLRIKVG